MLTQERLGERFRQRAVNADDQMALTMRVIEGLSYPEIAVYLEVPVRNVISRLSGARDHLRRRLAEGAEGAT